MNHVERDCRMRTTQAPGDRTLLGLFFAPCPSERHTQGLPLQDKILIPDLVAAVCEVPKNRKLKTSSSRRSGKMPERRTSASSLRALKRQDQHSSQMREILSKKFEDFA